MAATGRQEREMENKYEREKMKAQTPLERCRAHVHSRGGTGLKALGMAFKRADKNEDNQINYEEFKTVLHVSGFTLEPDKEREIFNSMDLDRTGNLNYDEFLIALRPPMSDRRRDVISRAFRQLDEHGRRVFAQFLYRSGARNKDGIVTEIEFKNYYERLSAGIDSDDDFVLMERQVTEIEFKNYYERLSAGIDSDDDFVFMMRQAWKLPKN